MDDENTHEVATLIGNTSSTDFYFYISVADYTNTGAWQTSKEAEVDAILALNESTRINVFIDGLDTGVGGFNFSTRFEQLANYIRFTKGRKAGLNTYTAYQNYCSFAGSNGFCMKESCVMRWNGASASTPDSYTWENWDFYRNDFMTDLVQPIKKGFNDFQKATKASGEGVSAVVPVGFFCCQTGNS